MTIDHSRTRETEASVDLLILDCDGVLIDSEIISAHALIELLARWDIQIDSDFVRKHFLGRSFPTVSGYVFDLFGVRLPDHFETDYRQRLLKKFETELHLMDGVETMLDRLAVPYCVATSSSPPRVERSLQLTGVFDRLAGRIFTASEVKHGKPAPDLFLHVAEAFNVAPERCLVVEDSSVGIQAGLSAGMRVAWFTGGSHMRHMRDGVIEVVGFPDGPHYKVATFDALFDHVPAIGQAGGKENHGA